MLAGCDTGTHILTGKTRPPLKPEDVILYQVPPDKFEYVGIVNSHSSGKKQRNMDAAVRSLKIHAAKIGANGILIGDVEPGREVKGTGFGSAAGFVNSGTAYGVGSSFSATSSGIYLSGRAIYLQP